MQFSKTHMTVKKDICPNFSHWKCFFMFLLCIQWYFPLSKISSFINNLSNYNFMLNRRGLYRSSNCICVQLGVRSGIRTSDSTYTGCLSRLDYYSNYKTHRAFKNVFSLISLKKLFCMFTMLLMKKFEKKAFLNALCVL